MLAESRRVEAQGDRNAVQEKHFTGGGLAFVGDCHLLMTGYRGLAVWDVGDGASHSTRTPHCLSAMLALHYLCPPCGCYR